MTIPAGTVSLADYQHHFRQRSDPGVVAYIDGYAADGLTHQANRAGFDRLRLLPRVLTARHGASAASTLFGQALDYPLLLAPTAYHRLVHPEGECATASGAGAVGTWMTVSTQASRTLEHIAAESTAPLWFQLYMRPERGQTLSLLHRAAAAGYGAIVVTADSPVSGVRNVEQRSGFQLPPGVGAVNLDGLPAAAPIDAGGRSPVFRGMLAQAMGGDDLAWLRDQVTLPLLVKGILHPADAERAIALGVDGIIVSNHGGRVLDTVPATIEALPAIAARVAGRVPVLLDGGIRRGTDIVKALASGASAVMLGRPVLHALAVGGAVGVAHMLTLLQTELEVAMALCGCNALADIEPGLLFRDAPPPV